MILSCHGGLTMDDGYINVFDRLAAAAAGESEQLWESDSFPMPCSVCPGLLPAESAVARCDGRKRTRRKPEDVHWRYPSGTRSPGGWSGWQVGIADATSRRRLSMLDRRRPLHCLLSLPFSSKTSFYISFIYLFFCWLFHCPFFLFAHENQYYASRNHQFDLYGSAHFINCVDPVSVLKLKHFNSGTLWLRISVTCNV